MLFIYDIYKHTLIKYDTRALQDGKKLSIKQSLSEDVLG